MIVYLKWEDAQQLTTEAWTDKMERVYTPCYCESVGFLLYDGEEGYIITDSVNAEQTGHVQQIPRGMVREWKIYEKE